MPPRSRKAWKSKADKLWSQYVRKRDKTCQWCGMIHPKQMHSHHIVTRSVLATRHDPENGILLCPGCHFKAHSHMLRFVEWFRTSGAGNWRYELLLETAYKSKQKFVPDYEEICLRLQTQLNELKDN